jgi:hypothetical protein
MSFIKLLSFSVLGLLSSRAIQHLLSPPASIAGGSLVERISPSDAERRNRPFRRLFMLPEHFSCGSTTGSGFTINEIVNRAASFHGDDILVLEARHSVGRICKSLHENVRFLQYEGEDVGGDQIDPGFHGLSGDIENQILGKYR